MPLPWVEDVTTTSAAPGLAVAGAVPVISVMLTTARLPSSLPPMVTLVTSMKLVPVIVTLLPPPSRSLAGLTAATVTDARGATESLQPGVRTAAVRPPRIAIALVSVISLPSLIE
jgi:hypothetical protein